MLLLSSNKVANNVCSEVHTTRVDPGYWSTGLIFEILKREKPSL